MTSEEKAAGAKAPAQTPAGPATDAAPAADVLRAREEHRHRLYLAIVHGQEEQGEAMPEDWSNWSPEELGDWIASQNSDPARVAWRRMQEILNAGLGDWRIQSNPEAHTFLFAMQALVFTAKKNSTAEDMVRRLSDALLRVQDMGKYIEDAALHEARSKGGKSKPPKLPAADALLAELNALMVARQLSNVDAKSSLKGKYKVTSQGLNAKLKKAKAA